MFVGNVLLEKLYKSFLNLFDSNKIYIGNYIFVIPTEYIP